MAGGSVEPSDARCDACGRARGYINTSVAYGAEVPDSVELCPWCIADGTAHERSERPSTSSTPVRRPRRRPRSTSAPRGSLRGRTGTGPCTAATRPSTSASRERASSSSYPDAWAALREELREYDWASDDAAAAAAAFIDGLDPECSAVAYLFRCPGCGTHLARWDMD